jgi:hypothetical protein
VARRFSATVTVRPALRHPLLPRDPFSGGGGDGHRRWSSFRIDRRLLLIVALGFWEQLGNNNAQTPGKTGE